MAGAIGAAAEYMARLKIIPKHVHSWLLGNIYNELLKGL